MSKIEPVIGSPAGVRRKSSRARWAPRCLMGVAVLSAVAMVGATLNGRPAINRPQTSNQIGKTNSESFNATLATIDLQLAAMAQQAGVETASTADNLTVARRLSLALVGSGLSLEELRALELQPNEQQIPWLTNYLLNDPRWNDYFAQRFSRALVGTDNGPFLLFRRRKLNAWLAEQLRNDVGYDHIVRDMMSSEGLWTDTPQVNFVTATMDEANEGRGDPIRLAGRTGRALLAQRIDCLQCHDDFVDNSNFGTSDQPIGGTQQHFHELAAFYSGTALASTVFSGITDDGTAYRYKYLGDSDETEVKPAVPFSPELLPIEGKPRARLAAWVTHRDNHAFARATVNRVWGLMLSRPLVEPVDSIPLDGSIPQVLDTLSDDFAANGFQLRRLIRLIAASSAFTRDSRSDFEVTEQHEHAWSVFPLTQLRPDQVVSSLLQASKLATLDDSSSIFTRLIAFGESLDFLQRFGDRGDNEFDSDAVTITQRLVMMNGELVAERTSVDLVNNACTRIASLVSDDRQAVELIFLTILNRHPSPDEQTEFGDYLASQAQDPTNKVTRSREQALSDIAWAMLNSTEFSWNH